MTPIVIAILLVAWVAYFSLRFGKRDWEGPQGRWRYVWLVAMVIAVILMLVGAVGLLFD